jgi:hypothetical protein
MKKIAISFLFLLILNCVVSCNKAGTGGDAEVSATIMHHERAIPGATLYVKFNAKDFPGEDVSKYDIVQVTGTAGHSIGHTHVKDLKQGYYFFYGVGYDSSIQQTVTGGVGIHIKYSQRKKEIDLTVPVTE